MTVEKLKIRPNLNEEFLNMLEQETLRIATKLGASKNIGDWKPSIVEAKYELIREAMLKTPGFIRKFRRTLISSGWLNFPDIPEPKSFLEWGETLPYRRQRAQGAFCLTKKLIKLYIKMPFKLIELNDDLVGSPTTYEVSNSFPGLVKDVILSMLGVSPKKKDNMIHITENKIRNFYYRNKICKMFGLDQRTILEVGGGYGSLCAELLKYIHTQTYFLVELPERLPFSYFYLRAIFNEPIQLICDANCKLDPEARIVLLTPWALENLKKEIDLLINTASFQHMDIKNLKFYFNQSERLNVRRMFLMNRNTQRDPSDVIIDEYPIPKSVKLLKDEKWLFGELCHRERYYEREKI